MLLNESLTDDNLQQAELDSNEAAEILSTEESFLDSIVQQIEIQNLIAFGKYPLEKLKGELLKEKIKELQEFDSCDPIIVRPTKDGFYEILDGHYRVAAAKKLELKTIPAFVYDWLLSDDDNDVEDYNDDALRYVSKKGPVWIQVKYGIDIYDYNYKESDGYKENKNILVDVNDSFSLSLDVYIERYLLTDHERYDLYDSIYSMGNPSKLSKEECTDEAVATEILRPDEGLIKDDGEGEEEFIKQRISRKRYGYIDRIKKYLKLDLAAYDYSNLQCMQERAKFLYYICEAENKKFKDVNFLEMLSKPSMENVDNSFWGWNTGNGEFIHDIKNSLEKEIALDTIADIKKSASEILGTWNDIIVNARRLFEMLDANGCDLTPFINGIKSKREKINSSSCSHNVSYTTPLTDLYLKIILLEYLGHINDTRMILEKAESNVYDVPPMFFSKMRDFSRTYLSDDDYDSFFDIQNVQEIAKYIYLKEETDKEERRRIRNSKEKLLRFLKLYKFADPTGEHRDTQGVSMLLVISCLQAILLDDSGELFEYSYHGFEGKKGNRRKTHDHVQAVLKKDDPVCDALQLYWVRKVLDRCYANMGLNDALQASREFEKLCCDIDERIFSSYSIDEMKKMSSLYVNELCVEDKIVLKEWQRRGSQEMILKFFSGEG